MELRKYVVVVTVETKHGRRNYKQIPTFCKQSIAFQMEKTSSLSNILVYCFFYPLKSCSNQQKKLGSTFCEESNFDSIIIRKRYYLMIFLRKEQNDGYIRIRRRLSTQIIIVSLLLHHLFGETLFLVLEYHTESHGTVSSTPT